MKKRHEHRSVTVFCNLFEGEDTYEVSVAADVYDEIYGSDADGNRGVYQQSVGDIEVECATSLMEAYPNLDPATAEYIRKLAHAEAEHLDWF